MTRKDYIALAKALEHVHQRNYSNAQAKQAVLDCLLAVSDVLQQDNPRFDKAKFLKACGAGL